MTHVVDDAKRRNFVHFKDKARDWSQARRTVLGVTNFVGLQVPAELRESAQGTAWARRWEDQML